jgi:ribosomal protein S18 acetylase RimI-like enzyme
MHQLFHLGSSDRAAMNAHLLALGAADRSDRFSAAVNDAYVQRYVGQIGYTGDLLIGALQGQELIGLVHAGVSVQGGESVAELGLSVSLHCRRQGLGQRLLRAALQAARQAGISRVELLYQSANSAMQALVVRLGGVITRQGGQSIAVFALQSSLTLH